MRADLHTHTVLSDGVFIPAELVRRATVLGHRAIAITDHVDMANLEHVVSCIVRATELSSDEIEVIPGVEITHVPPGKMDAVVSKARALGAKIVVVHGETVTEPVAPGTNLKAVSNPDVDVLAHPGFLTPEEADLAKSNGVAIEITGRAGHGITNGHVATVAMASGATMVVNSDAHTVGNLMDKERAISVALGAGIPKAMAEKAVGKNHMDIIRRL